MTVEPDLFPLMSEMPPLTALLGQLQLAQETQFYPSNHFLVPTPKAIFKSSPHHNHSHYHHNHSHYHHSQHLPPPQLDLLSALPQADPPLPLTLQADPPPPLPIALNTNAFPVEEFFTRQYEEYLGLLSTQILTLGEIKATLNKIEAATGEKPALVYAVFYPGTLEQETQQRLNNPIPKIATNSNW
jgi:hypothetical protein